MRQCGPLRTSAVSGRRYSNCTSALPKLHLRWVCNPTYPQRVGASSSRGLSFSLMHCIWLAWQCLAGFFGCGLVRCLGSAWGMCQSRCGSGSGIPKLVKRAGGLALSRPGRIDIVRPCFTGQRPRTCGRMTTCSLGAVHGWSTSSLKSWALRLGGTAVGILCAGVAALRATLATPRCSSSSRGDVGAVSGPLCGMRRRFRTQQSWALFDCLRGPARGGGGATGVLTHLEVWAPNMFPSEAEPLPTAGFHPPAWPEDLLDPPHPRCTRDETRRREQKSGGNMSQHMSTCREMRWRMDWPWKACVQAHYGQSMLHQNHHQGQTQR